MSMLAILSLGKILVLVLLISLVVVAMRFTSRGGDQR
jgi:hypothetical protein